MNNETNDIYDLNECEALSCPSAYLEYCVDDENNEDVFDYCHACVGEYCLKLSRNIIK